MHQIQQRNTAVEQRARLQKRVEDIDRAFHCVLLELPEPAAAAPSSHSPRWSSFEERIRRLQMERESILKGMQFVHDLRPPAVEEIDAVDVMPADSLIPCVPKSKLNLVYSLHARARMHKRKISAAEVEECVRVGARDALADRRREHIRGPCTVHRLNDVIVLTYQSGIEFDLDSFVPIVDWTSTMRVITCWRMLAVGAVRLKSKQKANRRAHARRHRHTHHQVLKFSTVRPMRHMASTWKLEREADTAAQRRKEQAQRREIHLQHARQCLVMRDAASRPHPPAASTRKSGAPKPAAPTRPERKAKAARARGPVTRPRPLGAILAAPLLPVVGVALRLPPRLTK
jgi:hypothetical protein